MLQITTSTGREGPFDAVEETAESFAVMANGAPTVLPKAVVGAGTVVPWVGELPEPPAPDLAPLRAEAVAQIDADVDAIYGAAIGLRQAEYEEAERQAHVYAQGGYVGTVPGMVQSWATAKGWTAEQAADDILQQAAIWRGAQDAIRAARLLCKEQARNAATAEALAGVRAAWSAFVAVVRGQLGLGAA